MQLYAFLRYLLDNSELLWILRKAERQIAEHLPEISPQEVENLQTMMVVRSNLLAGIGCDLTYELLYGDSKPTFGPNLALDEEQFDDVNSALEKFVGNNSANFTGFIGEDECVSRIRDIVTELS